MDDDTHDGSMGLSVVGIGDIVRNEIDFFFTPFFHAFFPSAAGSRSYQKPARFRVRAGSAQRQVARPIRVGEVQDLIQGRRIGMCRSRQGPGASKRGVTDGLLNSYGEQTPPTAGPGSFRRR